jgi:hypothetical protein
MNHRKNTAYALASGLSICLIALAMSSGAQEWKEVLSPTTVTALYITMDPADWDTIRNEQPVEGAPELLTRAPAWMNAPDETPIQVTIRRKGPTDPTLGNNDKVSLKIDINELVPGQRWRDLEKLSLEIGGDKPLQEGFAWVVHDLADEAGIYPYDAANAGWVQLYVNGDLKGFYTCAEQRDGQFLKNHDIYSPSATWLYKIDGGIELEAGPTDSHSPAHVHLDYAPFGTQSTLSELEFETDMPMWVDVQGLLTYAACMTFLQNSDMLFKETAKNSFAVDFNPPYPRKRQYYPWDLDAAFVGRHPTQDIMVPSKQKRGPGNLYSTTILQHPWFKQVYHAIYRELLNGPLSLESLTNKLNEIEPIVTPYMEADPYISVGDFDGLATWMAARIDNVWAQLTEPDIPRPIFNQDGGEVVTGFLLTMSSSAGSVYYTTDGSDPRAPGGAIAPSATLYTSPVPIEKTTFVTARAFDGSLWSALPAEAIFNLANYASPLRITEIMYHPADENTPDDGDEYEFLELKNTGTTDLDLSGFSFTGIDYVFPANATVSAGDRFVLARNAAAFSNRYGFAPDDIYFGKLSNKGEKIRLRNSDGNTQISVAYDDEPPWPVSPDGFGYSLVNINLNGDPDNPENWRASAGIHGSPYAPDPEPPYGVGVIVNEILSHTDPPYEDAIELYNPTTEPIDISGWFLSDDLTRTNAVSDYDLKKYRIPAGTQVPAGGFAVFYQQDFGPGNSGVPFGLSEHGDQVYLASADAAGNLNGYLVGTTFGATLNGDALGRYRTSVGVDFTVLEMPSFGTESPSSLQEFRKGGGAPNTVPKVGPVVINEIMYNPTGSDVEFIELYNLSAETVDLTDWNLQGGAFLFPAGTVLNAGSFLVLIDTNLITASQFRSQYAVPSAVPILGHNLILANEGETLRLEMPNDTLGAPDILIDRVRYNDKSPWPTEADGEGPSLEKVSPELYGNDPVNWRTVEQGGSPGRENLFPTGIAIVRKSSWKYHAEGADLGTPWRERNYSDSAWPRGDGLLGYGDPLVTTIIPSGPISTDRHITTYFRKDFIVNDDPSEITDLELEAWYDDGFIAYLNGVEILRSASMPKGPVSYLTPASSDRTAFGYETFDLSDAVDLLNRGHNMLAVEVHQVSPASPDLLWDAGLSYNLTTAETLAPPDASPRGGLFTNSVIVALSSDSPETDIRYTMDGSEPNLSSTLYTDTISISVSTELKARAFALGYNNSAVSSFLFTRLEPDTDGDTIADSIDIDDDNDGVDDSSESVAGTDPLDASSYLTITDLTIEPGGTSYIHWSSVSNRLYFILCSTNLQSGVWDSIVGPITGTPPLNAEMIPPASSDHEFYRIGVEEP